MELAKIQPIAGSFYNRGHDKIDEGRISGHAVAVHDAARWDNSTIKPGTTLHGMASATGLPAHYRARGVGRLHTAGNSHSATVVHDDALVSIAEAATAQLAGIVELLECVIYAIDDAIRLFNENRRLRGYTLKWWYKGYEESTASFLTAPVQGGGWALGLQRGTEPRMKLGEDSMEVLAWLQTILEPTSHLPWNDQQLTVVRPSLTLRNQLVVVFAIEEGLMEQFELKQKVLTAQQVVSIEYLPEESVRNSTERGCWRNKIRKGIILGNFAYPDRDAYFTLLEGFRDMDCLLLTAGALWSLFDNNLERNCDCTFTSNAEGKGKGEFLKFERKKKIGEWYVWHLQMDEDKVCDGKSCKEGIDDKFEGEDSLTITSPCIFGWHARIRTVENNAFVPPRIAADINLGNRFNNANAITLTPQTIQVGGQLGFSHGLVASLTAFVSWAMTRYAIGNMPEDDLLLSSFCRSVILREATHPPRDDSGGFGRGTLHSLIEPSTGDK
ncbi:hypothetical protein B7463_g2360, partial [Scytalidium lignicola]